MSNRTFWRAFWRRESKKRSRHVARQRRLRQFEWLEPRWALASPTLAAISDVTLVAGAPLNIALDGADTDGDTLTYTATSTNSAVTPTITPSANRSLKIQVDSAANGIHGVLVLELFEDLAPDTTARIIQLASQGFYDGLTFHRVISNFMIQGGDPTATGEGGSGTDIDDEYHASLQFTGRGLLAMAKGGDDTGDSQFFITSTATRWLDFNHTIFGMLTEGNSVLSAVENVPKKPVAEGETPWEPVNPVFMTKVEVLQDTQNGVLRLSAPPGTTGDAYVTVNVSDGSTSATRTFHVTIQADTNTAPAFLQEIAPIQTSANTQVKFQIPISNPGGSATYYRAVVSPSSANLEVAADATGLVTVTPKNGATGVFSIQVQVANSTAFQDNVRTGDCVDTQMVPVYVSPAAPVIQALLADDGSVSTSTTTSDNNSSSSSTLTFRLSGLVAGAQVKLLAGSQVIGQATASGATMDLTTNGTSTLANGVRSITATQTLLLEQPVQVGNLSTKPDLVSPVSTALTITVAAGSASGVPALTDFEKAVAQDATLTFSVSDFSSHFIDADGTLTTVKIIALPTHGTLKLSGTAVTAGQEIPSASLANLTYQGTSGYNGKDTFQWNGSDGASYADAASTVTIAVGQTGVFSGWVWLDADGNGTRDAGELGLSGVVVQLHQKDSQGNWAAVSGVGPVMTGADGSYRFQHLAPGTYKAVRIAQPGDYLVAPASNASQETAVGDSAVSADLVGGQGLRPEMISQRLFLLSTPAPDEILRGFNKAPTVDLSGTGNEQSGYDFAAAYTDTSSAVHIAAVSGSGSTGATVTDPDGDWMTSMTVAIANRRDGDSEVLAATPANANIKASYASGVLTLTGAATTADYQQALRSITYQNTATSPTQGPRTITARVFDGVAFSNTPVTTVTVSATAGTTAPTAALTTAPPTIGAASAGASTTTLTITYTATSGSTIDTSSFATSNLTVSNGATVTGVSASGNAVTYTIKAPSTTWSASTQGAYTVGLAANQVKDAAGRYVAASASLASFTVDTTAPTASVTTAPPALGAGSASASTTTLTVTYADTGTGIDTSSFATSNLTVSNGATVTAVSINGNAVTYTITAPASTWAASTQGTYTVALAANQVKDLAGNYVAANSSLTSFTVDMVNPTAAVTTAPPAIAAASASASTTTLTVTYTDSGVGMDTSSFATSNLTVSNGATVTGISTSGNAVTYTITAPASTWGASTQGTYTVSLVANQVKDTAGHYVAANSSLTSFMVDTVVPTASVTTAPASITAANASTSTTSLTVTYSDADTGIDTSSFAASNLTVSNGATVTGISINGNAVTYTITAPAATWSASAQGAYTVSLAANQVKDLVGNYVAANSSLASFKVDTAAPTATVTTAPPTIDSSMANANTTSLTVTYTDTGTGIDTNSLSTSNLTVDKGATVTGISVSGNAVTYTITAPAATWGASAQGTYTVSLGAEQVKDLAGNYVAANSSLASFVVNTSDSSTVTVVRNGSQVTVTGAPGVGTLEFIAGANQNTVFAGGEAYTYSSSEVTSFVFDGAGTDAVVQINGGDAAQTAQIHPSSATFQSAGITVSVVNATTIHMYAGSGDSEVTLYDSAGDDTLLAQGTLAMLTGDDFSEMALDFQRVKAVSSAGGQDSAFVQATDFVLTQEGPWTNL